MILLVAAYVFQPLSTFGRGGYSDTSRELSALQAERDRVLDSIQEIDMDHSMGKVPEEHYQRQRGSLVLEGAEILRSIDELQQNGVPDEAAIELEAAVARLRAASSNSNSGMAKANTQGACPTCGEAIHPGDRFCSNCGSTLEEQVA
jgi:ribosomal protein L32